MRSICLDIPDDDEFMDPELVGLLKRKVLGYPMKRNAVRIPGIGLPIRFTFGGFATFLLRLFNHQKTLPAKHSSLREDIDTGAEWIAKALLSSGYDANFTPDSIAEIERFFRDHTVGSQPRLGGLLAEGLGTRLFALGCYCGEVLRRELGGDWITDDGDPNGEVNVALKFDNEATCWPVQRMMKRLRSEEDDLVAWAVSIRYSQH